MFHPFRKKTHIRDASACFFMKQADEHTALKCFSYGASATSFDLQKRYYSRHLSHHFQKISTIPLAHINQYNEQLFSRGRYGK